MQREYTLRVLHRFCSFLKEAVLFKLWVKFSAGDGRRRGEPDGAVKAASFKRKSSKMPIHKRSRIFLGNMLYYKQTMRGKTASGTHRIAAIFFLFVCAFPAFVGMTVDTARNFIVRPRSISGDWEHC